MQIQSAEYETSATQLQECPDSQLPEFAFIGRSNVGKSSLINMLTGKKDLAIVSSKPGRTQMINFFTVNRQWKLVDLPGYGYAKASLKQREQFREFVSDYLINRTNLHCVFVLIDAKIKPQQLDLDFTSWLAECSIPFVLIFTKIDKTKQGTANTNKKEFLAKLQESTQGTPRDFMASSKTGTGRKDILDFIGKATANF